MPMIDDAQPIPDALGPPTRMTLMEGRWEAGESTPVEFEESEGADWAKICEARDAMRDRGRLIVPVGMIYEVRLSTRLFTRSAKVAWYLTWAEPDGVKHRMQELPAGGAIRSARVDGSLSPAGAWAFIILGRYRVEEA